MSVASSRKLMVGLAFAISYVINPAYFAGCIGSESPNFGEPEMLEVLSAANAMGPWRFEEDGAQYEAELTLVQEQGDDSESARRPTPLSMRALACASRTFMQSAAACVTSTTVPLAGTLTLRRTEPEASVELVSEQAYEGELEVFGLELDNAYIHLEHGFESIDLRASDGRNFELIAFHAATLGATSVDIHFARED